MKEALQLEFPFTEIPTNSEVLSDSLKLAKAEVKTQIDIISGQFVLAGIIAVKSAMIVGNAIATPFRVVAMIAMFVLMALSSAVRTIFRVIVESIHDPIEAILRFVLMIAVVTALIFYVILGIYAAVLLPLLIATPIISFLLMMAGCMWAMYKGFSAKFA